MSVAKIIELTATGSRIEEAVRERRREGGRELRNIQHVYVDGIEALRARTRRSRTSTST